MKNKKTKVAECVRDIPVHVQTAASISIKPRGHIIYTKNIYKDGQFFLELSNGKLISGAFFNY
jgi:hypothetical protein